MYLYFFNSTQGWYIYLNPILVQFVGRTLIRQTTDFPQTPHLFFWIATQDVGCLQGAYIRPRLAFSYTAGSLQFPYIKLLWKIPNLTTRQYLPQLKQHPSGGTQWFTMHAFHRGIWYCVPPFLLFNRKLSRTMWRLALTVPYSKKLTFKWTSR